MNLQTLYQIAFDSIDNLPYEKMYEQVKKDGKVKNITSNQRETSCDFVSLNGDTEYSSFLDKNTKMYYFRFYDKDVYYQESIPLIISDKLKNITDYLKLFDHITGSALWIIGPGSVIPDHEDTYPATSEIVPIKSDNFYLIVDGEKKSCKNGESIVFNNSQLHSTINTSDKWWFLLQLHISNN
jgi:hypothetical protein